MLTNIFVKIIDKKNPPIIPEYVLLGLILVNLGPLKILPSFAPGYYEKGDGKDLGSVLEFKSEIKVGLDIFENSKLSYSYSHISNNEWGDTNPGTDNQQITFSKNF